MTIQFHRTIKLRICNFVLVTNAMKHRMQQIQTLLTGTFIFATLLLGWASCESAAAKDTTPLAVKVNIPVQEEPSTNTVRHMRRDSSAADFFPSIPLSKYDSIFAYNSNYQSDGFDFPVGKPNAQSYFKAQEFGSELHLGEDWNGVRGGNTDLGDPVYAISNGLVTFSKEVCCGWGNVVRIVHRLPNHPEYQYVESVYAHLHNLYVQPGQLIQRGEKIGTIGTAGGRYSAHLHLEVRNFINMSLGPGYSEDTFGFLIPTNFIQSNRPY